MAKHVPLQLMMVNLTNGHRGLFVGLPLIDDRDVEENDTQVEQVSFSAIQQLPEEMTLAELIKMVQERICPRTQRIN